jgi:hypothetical protein
MRFCLHLKSERFVANPYDQCVFNKEMENMQVTITLHVDELMISSVSEAAIESVLQGLIRDFKKINTNRGKK